MKTIIIDDTTAEPRGCVATVGFFDGVHCGHQHLIGLVVDEARRRGLLSAVVTFDRHPRQVVQPGWQPQLLSTLEEKRVLLARTGIDVLAVLPFDATTAQLSGRDFMAQVLKARLGVKVLYMGYDNRFGHNRADGFSDFVRYGHELGMDVRCGDAFSTDDIRVSSSYVRRCLAQGDVTSAAQCLGRPYQLTGQVVGGEHVGTGLGYPTANLQPDEPLKLVPASGVYAVRVAVGDSTSVYGGMMNIGTRPTFGGRQQTLEVNIFQFEGNLYGQRMDVQFVERLRDEQCFGSGSQLAEQLARDRQQAEAVLRAE